VTLVGTVLAQASTRPNLDWKFIVLDTEGVNAYAAPGGLVHITKGLLGLMKTEAELAGVLGHEITHVTVKHTVRAIQKSKGISAGADLAGGGSSLRDQFIAKMSAAAFQKLFDGEFSREDENEADKVGSELANKVGYAPSGIGDVLRKIDARNGAREDRNGMFASHPATKDRIEKNEKLIASEKLSSKATGEARYRQNITFDAKPITEIATNADGAAGLAGGDKKKGENAKADDGKKADEPKKKGGFGSALGGITGSKQQASTQQTSSAGARGGLPDRDATGGPNKSVVTVKVTDAEVQTFKKGIAA
jgi:predicted Zn-dependent protease